MTLCTTLTSSRGGRHGLLPPSWLNHIVRKSDKAKRLPGSSLHQYDGVQLDLFVPANLTERLKQIVYKYHTSTELHQLKYNYYQLRPHYRSSYLSGGVSPIVIGEEHRAKPALSEDFLRYRDLVRRDLNLVEITPSTPPTGRRNRLRL